MTGSKRKFLGFVPRDSIWHPLIKYLVIPIIALIVVFLLVDRVVMPGITRHGSEFPLPSVVGLSFTEAMDTLDQYGVDIYIAGEESSPDIPDGTVMVQTPLPGSMVKTGRRVKVIISSGRELVEVPYMVGFSQRRVTHCRSTYSSTQCHRGNHLFRGIRRSTSISTGARSRMSYSFHNWSVRCSPTQSRSPILSGSSYQRWTLL
jgi:hypothetical protein